MATAESKTRYTPQDLLTMPEGDRYELVDGQLVEKQMGWEASYVASRLYHFICAFLEQHSLGWPVVEGSYQCFADEPNRVRKPDVSFVSKERMPSGDPPAGHNTAVPDLAVEAISPTNTFSEIERKVHEYLDAGVRLVWVIDPPTRTIHVYRPNDSNVTLLREADSLSGEDVLPGFQCHVSQLFKRPV